MATISSEAGSFEVTPTAIYHPTVHDIPTDDRPRERLQKKGAETFSTSELLVIILRTGTVPHNVMELSTEILTRYGGLGGLISAGFHELSNKYALGPAKTAQLKAALEIGKRLSALKPDKTSQVRSADDAAN